MRRHHARRRGADEATGYEDVRFELGDLALALVPASARGRPWQEAALAQLAAVLGVAPEALASYRAMAALWPPTQRVVGAPWEAYRALSGRGDRFALLARDAIASQDPSPT